MMTERFFFPIIYGSFLFGDNIEYIDWVTGSIVQITNDAAVQIDI